MPTKHLTALMLAPVLALAACTGDTPDAGGGLAETVAREIREEMASENLELGKGKDGEPRAEITPAGDLLIDGQAVALTDAQREQMLAYREQIVHVAESGAAIGMQGAELAKEAVTAAVAGALRGDSAETVEARVEKEAEAIKASARALCDRLPALYATQQALAESVPEFAPYAGMDESDIDDCRVE